MTISKITILIIVLVLMVSGGVGVLYTRLWDPAWNPFRLPPEAVLARMITAMEDIKTYQTKTDLKIEAKNESNVILFLTSQDKHDRTDPQVPKVANNFDISLETEGMKFSLAGETIVIERAVYFKLTTIPMAIQPFLGILGLNLKDLKDQWIKIPPEELEKEEKELEKRLIELFQERWKELFYVKEELPDKKIQNIETYHYLVALNKEEMKKIIPELLETLEKSNGFFGLSGSRERAKNARVIAEMSQIRTIAELIYSKEGGYNKLSCDYPDPDYGISILCEDIAEQVGAEPVIYASSREYCAYTPLTVEGYYYCIDSRGRRLTTDIFPEESGYCNGNTFVCPTKRVDIPSEAYEKAAKEEFLKELDEFFEKISEITAEVWIGKKDNLLYKIKGEKEIDLSVFEEDERGIITIKADMDLSNFNQPVEIEAPKDYKSWEEFLPTRPFFPAMPSFQQEPRPFPEKELTPPPKRFPLEEAPLLFDSPLPLEASLLRIFQELWE